MILALLYSLAFGDSSEGVGDLDVFSFDPSSYGLYSVSSAKIIRLNSIHLSSGIYYWPQPSVFIDDQWEDLQVKSRVAGHLSLGYSPIPRVSVAASFPLLGRQVMEGETGMGVGDFRLQGKYSLLNERSKLIKMAVSSDLTFPSGNPELLFGNSSPSITPSLIVELTPKNKLLRWNTEIGYVVNSNSFGKGLKLGTGIGFLASDRFELFSEFQHFRSSQGFLMTNLGVGSITSRDKVNIRTTVIAPIDSDLELWNMRYGLSLEFNPSWEYRSRDEDRDGILNKSDKCSDQKEDIDGFQDDDGCPEPDNDYDGILDLQDECPLEEEDIDGFQDDDGCPEPDNDQDNILDFTDRCPDKAETINGYRDFDGCPDHSQSNDHDGDRFADNKDKCPFLAEDFDGYQDEDGCPEIDNDNDGILDKDEDPEDE